MKQLLVLIFLSVFLLSACNASTTDVESYDIIVFNTAEEQAINVELISTEETLNIHVDQKMQGISTDAFTEGKIKISKEALEIKIIETSENVSTIYTVVPENGKRIVIMFFPTGSISNGVARTSPTLFVTQQESGPLFID